MDNRVYGYARVSSSEQNTDRQLEALIQFGVPEQNIRTKHRVRMSSEKGIST